MLCLLISAPPCPLRRSALDHSNRLTGHATTQGTAITIEDRRQRYIVTAVVMTAAIMQILDTTIVTVALPHMRGQFQANSEQITWVLTSYLISSGIFMPLTGYLTDRIGRRNYLLASVGGFALASFLCGIAASLDEIVLFRLLQGIAGAGLIPTAQAILVDSYPEQERGQAMAIFGVGAMVGPILGPTLGGYLTQTLEWRWIFFINLPVAALALLGVWKFVPKTTRRERHSDWLGFAFLVIAVAAMQFVFDRGQQNGWFHSDVIQIAAAMSVFGYICLIVRNIEMGRDAIFSLRVFRDRNFTVSSILLAIFMFSMYGVLALQPAMLESLFAYPTFTTGLVLAPRGVAAMASMFLAGQLINRIGAKPLILTGILITTFSTVVMTWYSLQIDAWWVIWPTLVQGFGLGLVFVPLATITFATLPSELSSEAAGLRQLARTIGASAGVSLSGTIVAQQAQATWNHLGGMITPFSQPLSDFLAGLHMSLGNPHAAAALGAILARHARFQGMIDAYAVLGWGVLVAAPLVLLLKKGVGRYSNTASEQAG